MVERQLVQGRQVHVQQAGHLVDEGAGAAGTGTVHPFLQRALEKDNLGVLAAQLDHHIGIGQVTANRSRRGKNLLHKGDAALLGHPQAGRAGNSHLQLLAFQQFPQFLQFFQGHLPNPGPMALVTFVNNLIPLVEHHRLDGGGTDVQADFITHNTLYTPVTIESRRYRDSDTCIVLYAL